MIGLVLDSGDILLFFGILVTSLVAPLTLGYVTTRQRDKEKHENWIREDEKEERETEKKDEVAKQAAEAAELLVAAQKASTDAANEVARLVAETDQLTQRKLDGIDAQAKRTHTLVNSEMTAARQSELDQTRITLIMMHRVVDLGKKLGIDESSRDTAIEATETRIRQLEKLIADREEEQRRMEADATAAEVKIGDGKIASTLETPEEKKT